MLLEDYGLIGDLQSAALVGRNGSIDWLCLPRFDSASCFSALLGRRAARALAAGAGRRGARDARAATGPGTLVLETDFETADGAVRVIDFMPRRGDGPPRVMRIVEGAARPGADADGARAAPRLRVDHAVGRARVRTGSIATAGPGRVPAQHAAAAADRGRHGQRRVRRRSRAPASASTLTLAPLLRGGARRSRTPTRRSPARRPGGASGAGAARYEGAYRDEVLTSLIVLKAMTLETTGALIAAPTTSLPEDIGGVRNWDYRYCWLRDSVLALEALLDGGLHRRGAGLPRLPAARRHGRPGDDPDHVRRSAASGA